MKGKGKKNEKTVGKIVSVFLVSVLSVSALSGCNERQERQGDTIKVLPEENEGMKTERLAKLEQELGDSWELMDVLVRAMYEEGISYDSTDPEFFWQAIYYVMMLNGFKCSLAEIEGGDVKILVAGGGTVLASGLFSETVERLIGTARGTKYEQEDTQRYAQIGKSTTPVDAGEGYVTSAENGGITISVSDAVCDGYSLYFTATLTGDKDLLNDADWIGLSGDDNTPAVISINGKNVGWSPKSYVKSAEDTYVMMGEIPDLFAQAEQNDIQMKHGDTLEIAYMGKKIVGADEDKHMLNEETGEYEYAEVLDVTGDWHLKFPVAVDTSVNRSFVINKEDNGIKVKDAIVTKTGLLVTLELPDMTQAPYNDPYNDPDIAFYDKNGNAMADQLPSVPGRKRNGSM